jgi:hypothetical protein
MFLIEVMAACGEILFSGKHLPAGKSAAAEEVVVTVDELGLPYGRIQLTRGHGVKPLDASELTAPCGYGSRRHYDHTHPRRVELGYLVDKSRHAGHVEGAVAACEYITTDFYGNIFEAWCRHT